MIFRVVNSDSGDGYAAMIAELPSQDLSGLLDDSGVEKVRTGRSLFANLILKMEGSFSWSDRVFKANYGINKTTVRLLIAVASALDDRVKDRHVLWMLFFLKVYCTSDVSGVHFGVTAKTFDDHVWHVIRLLEAGLDVVSVAGVAHVEPALAYFQCHQEPKQLQSTTELSSC